MSAFRWAVVFLGLLSVLAIVRPSARADADDVAQARKFLDDFIAKLRPVEIEANRAWWDANITGKDEDYERKEKAQN